MKKLFTKRRQLVLTLRVVLLATIFTVGLSARAHASPITIEFQGLLTTTPTQVPSTTPATTPATTTRGKDKHKVKAKDNDSDNDKVVWASLISDVPSSSMPLSSLSIH